MRNQTFINISLWVIGVICALTFFGSIHFPHVTPTSYIALFAYAVNNTATALVLTGTIFFCFACAKSVYQERKSSY